MHIERERSQRGQRDMKCVCIHIYIYIEREREIDLQREREIYTLYMFVMFMMCYNLSYDVMQCYSIITTGTAQDTRNSHLQDIFWI